jgi:uncharacterized C2H2 Zn-finger protein
MKRMNVRKVDAFECPWCCQVFKQRENMETCLERHKFKSTIYTSTRQTTHETGTREIW